MSLPYERGPLSPTSTSKEKRWPFRPRCRPSAFHSRLLLAGREPVLPASLGPVQRLQRPRWGEAGTERRQRPLREGVAGRRALRSSRASSQVRPDFSRPHGRAEDGCPKRRGQSRVTAIPPRAPSPASRVPVPMGGIAPGCLSTTWVPRSLARDGRAR